MSTSCETTSVEAASGWSRFGTSDPTTRRLRSLSGHVAALLNEMGSDALTPP